MTENELIKYYKRAMEIQKEEFGEDSKATELYKTTIGLIKKIQQYQAIGTVEECREARERQKEKKPVCRSIFTDGTRFPGCPTCFSRIDRGAFYCSGCGQKLDWH